MNTEERDLLDEALRRATSEHSGAALDAALARLGWHDALATEPRTAVSLLFEQQGRAATTSSALDDVLVAGLGIDDARGAAVLVARADLCEPPGKGGEPVIVDGLGTARILEAEYTLVLGRAEDRVFAATVRSGELVRRPVDGMDPWLGLVEVTGAASAVSPARSVDVGMWRRAEAWARVAVGHEILGASSAMLELARRHAVERVQFGRPIAAFQAVRHRLAETLVALESARALLDVAWVDAAPDAAALAKAVAGRSGRTAIRHCQQVLAGMGFTIEHPFHRYVRRVLVLDEMFGSARALTAALGREVLASRQLPPALAL